MKYIFAVLSFLITLQIYAQETKMPLGRNVLLTEQAKQYFQEKNAKKSLYLNKTDELTVPISDYFFQNAAAPNSKLWNDSSVQIIDNQAIFDTKNSFGVLYNQSFGEADVLTTKNINTNNAGKAFIYFNYSTGADWLLNDSLIFQVKGSNNVWTSLWTSANELAGNKDVFLEINFENDLETNLLQFRFVSYCNSVSNKNEVFKLGKFVVSSFIETPFYESFRDYDKLNKLPSNRNWIGVANQININDSAKMLWGNSIVFNSINNFTNQTYFNNNGLYGNADTLMLNPIDLTTFYPNNKLVLSFWIRSFVQTKATDSIYIETLNNLGVWQRVWSSGKLDTNYQKVNILLTNGRLRHKFFTFRIINKGIYANSEMFNFAIAALKLTFKQELPLYEDFSTTAGFYPNEENWIDNKAFINNNFPKNQPSLNVATFDGLDENGNAYSKLPIKSVADVLTCKGFDLSGSKESDSIFLSFFYQYHLQGTSGQIQPTDSLVLEFKTTPNDQDSFEIVWEKSALDTLPYDTFIRVMIPVKQKYLHDDFQFRFKNVGSLSGNVSQWHLDYIKFDSDRGIKDSFENDLAISGKPSSLLKKYNSMPWAHFELNKTEYTNDSIIFSVFNNDIRDYSIDYKREFTNSENNLIFTKNNINGSVPFGVSTELYSVNSTNITSSNNNLVKVFQNKFSVSSNGFVANDNIPTNDTLTTYTKFSNYFAYDDGTAEAGYGIKLKTNAAVALAYDLEKLDTIYGVQIFFNQSEFDVSSRTFDLVVWDLLSPIRQNANQDRILYRKKGLKPIYTNTLNGFATIMFDSGVVVPKRFYVGWEQLGQFVLNIGLDENYKLLNKTITNPNMFYKTDGFWLPTEIPGALMIRPLLGKFVDVPTSTNKVNKTKTGFDYQIFPNPAKENISVLTNNKNELNIKLFDLTGKLILENTFNPAKSSINLPELNTGIYIVVITDLVTGKNSNKKLIINK